MSHRILLVDDDPWIRRMVSTMLERNGHDVCTANNGEEGLTEAKRFHPDLVITDVLMDKMDGWTFVRNLRSKSETSLLPVIFLTALDNEEDRIRGFRLGADDYLSKPFRFEELRLRIERTLRAVNRVRDQATDLKRHEDRNVGLTGDLSQLGVSALLTTLEMERKSGVLLLKCGNQTGRLFLRAGRPLAANLGGDKTLDGPEAVYQMLRWGRGSFQFNALDVEMEDSIGTSLTHLLMEGARLFDEETEAAS